MSNHMIGITRMCAAICLLAAGCIGLIISIAMSYEIGIVASFVLMWIALITAILSQDDAMPADIPDDSHQKIYQQQP